MAKLISKAEVTSGLKTAAWTAVGVVVMVPLVSAAVAKIKTMFGMSA